MIGLSEDYCYPSLTFLEKVGLSTCSVETLSPLSCGGSYDPESPAQAVNGPEQSN